MGDTSGQAKEESHALGSERDRERENTVRHPVGRRRKNDGFMYGVWDFQEAGLQVLEQVLLGWPAGPVRRIAASSFSSQDNSGGDPRVHHQVQAQAPDLGPAEAEGRAGARVPRPQLPSPEYHRGHPEPEGPGQTSWGAQA